jgi:hypothetical protein
VALPSAPPWFSPAPAVESFFTELFPVEICVPSKIGKHLVYLCVSFRCYFRRWSVFFPVLFPVQMWFSSEVGKHLICLYVSFWCCFRRWSVSGGGVFLSGIVSGSDLVFVGGWKTPPQFPTWLIDGWCLLVGMEVLCSFGGVVFVSCSWRSTSVGVFLFLVSDCWSLETEVVTWRRMMSLLFGSEVMVDGVWR